MQELLKPQNFPRGLRLGAEQFFKIFGGFYFPNWGLTAPILIFWLTPYLFMNALMHKIYGTNFDYMFQKNLHYKF